jgi:hypothetical protein
MLVYRVEHDCINNCGPMSVKCLINWSDYPNYYGAVLEPVSQDPNIAKYMTEEMYCGTTEEQFPRWFSNEEYKDQPFPPEWYVKVFEVDDSDAVVGNNQVIFKRHNAKVISMSRTEFPR